MRNAIEEWYRNAESYLQKLEHGRDTFSSPHLVQAGFGVDDSQQADVAAEFRETVTNNICSFVEDLRQERCQLDVIMR